jgi:hypothetical protein
MTPHRTKAGKILSWRMKVSASLHVSGLKSNANCFPEAEIRGST